MKQLHIQAINPLGAAAPRASEKKLPLCGQGPDFAHYKRAPWVGGGVFGFPVRRFLVFGLCYGDARSR